MIKRSYYSYNIVKRGMMSICTEKCLLSAENLFLEARKRFGNVSLVNLRENVLYLKKKLIFLKITFI